MKESKLDVNCLKKKSEDAVMIYKWDILAKGLDVIFCGLNPASSAVESGHNFSNPRNRFWSVLYLAGFTDICIRPHDEHRLLEYRCGVTAVVSRATKRADEISTTEFRQVRPEFEVKMRYYMPRVIAFLGKRGLAGMISKPDIRWGILPIQFAGTTAWVLPNPSGLNRGFPLKTLVAAYAELRKALGGSSVVL
ncbi:MAG: G/U mismatch-specific DNA glycosylase [Nitrospira sp.]|nr:G/U mismatch-specific DNA glycosylase [Nitrospira sp.]